MFSVEVATIQRDLRELRARGLPIHSIRGRVRFLRRLEESELRELVTVYLGSATGVVSYPKNISLTVRKLKERSIELFVSIVSAIEERQVLELEYYKMFDDETVVRVVEPYDLIPTTRDWRLIARSDGYFKQFLVENIRELRMVGRTFRRSKEYDSNQMFKNSLEYWLSENVFDIVLRVRKHLAPLVKASSWTEDQEVARREDGSIILKFKANSIEQTGNWILTWGNGIEVLEPVELREYVVQRAKGVINTNKTRSKKTIIR